MSEHNELMMKIELLLCLVAGQAAIVCFVAVCAGWKPPDTLTALAAFLALGVSGTTRAIVLKNGLRWPWARKNNAPLLTPTQPPTDG